MLNTLCRLCGFALIAFNVFGCSTFKPQPDATASFMERKQLKKAGEVSVSMAVPPAEESAAVFGVKVAKKKFSRSGWKSTTKAFFTGSRYQFSPVSSLYVFGRRQNIALQKIRGTIHERNHLRLWLTPIIYRGNDVWTGQISRDIGIRFAKKPS